MEGPARPKRAVNKDVSSHTRCVARFAAEANLKTGHLYFAVPWGQRRSIGSGAACREQMSCTCTYLKRPCVPASMQRKTRAPEVLHFRKTGTLLPTHLRC